MKIKLIIAALLLPLFCKAQYTPAASGSDSRISGSGTLPLVSGSINLSRILSGSMSGSGTYGSPVYFTSGSWIANGGTFVYNPAGSGTFTLNGVAVGGGGGGGTIPVSGTGGSIVLNIDGVPFITTDIEGGNTGMTLASSGTLTFGGGSDNAPILINANMEIISSGLLFQTSGTGLAQFSSTTGGISLLNTFDQNPNECLIGWDSNNQPFVSGSLGSFTVKSNGGNLEGGCISDGRQNWGFGNPSRMPEAHSTGTYANPLDMVLIVDSNYFSTGTTTAIISGSDNLLFLGAGDGTTRGGGKATSGLIVQGSGTTTLTNSGITSVPLIDGTGTVVVTGGTLSVASPTLSGTGTVTGAVPNQDMVFAGNPSNFVSGAAVTYTIIGSGSVRITVTGILSGTNVLVEPSGTYHIETGR